MHEAETPHPESVSQNETDVGYIRERILADAARARIYPWGVRDYGSVLRIQEYLRQGRREDAVADTWLAGEHETVITQGVRATETDVVVPGDFPIFQIDRGGQTTLHNPGQLVIYPILKVQGGLLAQARLSRTLLLTVRDWLGERYGIELAIPPKRPGLFHGERKVAAIGVSIHGRVSMHGIAINLCNDLTPWQRIVPCGEPTTRPENLSNLIGQIITPAELIDALPQWLEHAWGYESVERIERLEL